MTALVDKALALGLPATAAVLAKAPAGLLDPTAAPWDARLVEPAATQPKRILGQMARRGLDPVLVRAFYAGLSSRPLESALVAADVLARSLLPPGDPLLAALQPAARRLGAAGATDGKPGVDLNRHPAESLIAAHARDPSLQRRATADLLALAYDFQLGALDEFVRRRDPLLAKDEVRASIRAYARLLALAHLPSLASVYLDFLSRVVGWRAAALDLCETLFDADAPQKIPGNAIQRGDVPDAELNDVAEYLVYRTYLALGDAGRAHSLLRENLANRDAALGPPSLRLDVVRAHVGAIFRQNVVPRARLDEACAADRLWRYGAHVRAMVAAQTDPAAALQLYHDFVTGFGNELGCGFDVLQGAPPALRRDVGRLTAREAFHLSHEPAPWKLLVIALGDRAEVHAATREIDRRLAAQR